MGFLTRNVGWKLLALMMAAALWIIVNREAELTTIASARLEFKNIGPGLDITGGAPERVSLRVHGPSGHITPSMLRDLAVVLDCAKVTGPGVYTFNLNGHHASLPEDVAVDSSIPSQLHLTFERDVERQVPVVPKYSHAPPPGYRVARYQLDPAVLSVRGPESRINRLESLETDPIDLSAVVSTMDVRVPAHVADPQVRLSGAPFAIHFKAEMEKSPSR
jgi:YbbR domain-containing protein